LLARFIYLFILISLLRTPVTAHITLCPAHAHTARTHREEQLAKLQEGKEFDLLVVGGGATGAGIALDAATRGLNIALVEKYDFSSGTSSRSTKLVHGGVRYLEKARHVVLHSNTIIAAACTP
jgi:heterodisulfide reductase subunit A-like polyferredoxin